MITGDVDPTTAARNAVQEAIAVQLATGHGWAWGLLDEQVRCEYVKDAAALVDQGLTPIWGGYDPGPNPSLQLEVEAAEFDRAMAWWMDFVSARHPDWGIDGGVAIAPEMENLDPEDWDAWVSIAVTVSEQARRLYMQKFEQLHGVAAPTAAAPVSPNAAPASSPPAVAAVKRNRFATTVAAVLANRHGRGWLQQPSDVRAAYVDDAQRLIDAGLTCW